MILILEISDMIQYINLNKIIHTFFYTFFFTLTKVPPILLLVDKWQHYIRSSIFHSLFMTQIKLASSTSWQIIHIFSFLVIISSARICSSTNLKIFFQLIN